MFRTSDHLSRINTGMSGKKISNYTGNPEIKSGLCTEKFNSHQGTGDRCIRCSGKDCHESKPANKAIGKGTTADKALPSVAPTKNNGVTSPPLNPTPMVKVVKISFNRKSYHICCSVKDATITGTPKPMYFVVPSQPHSQSNQNASPKGRRGG